MTRRLLLVGGSAGSGKSTVARSWRLSSVPAGCSSTRLGRAQGGGRAGQPASGSLSTSGWRREPFRRGDLAAHVAASETSAVFFRRCSPSTRRTASWSSTGLAGAVVRGGPLDDRAVSAPRWSRPRWHRLAGRERQARPSGWTVGSGVGAGAAEARRHGFPVLDPLPFEPSSGVTSRSAFRSPLLGRPNIDQHVDLEQVDQGRPMWSCEDLVQS